MIMLQKQDRIEGFKLCPRCKKQKPLTEFYRKHQGRDGYYSYCKECYAALAVIYNTENKERIRKQKKEYHSKNKERISQRNKEYYAKNRKLQKDYYSRNKEEVLNRLKFIYYNTDYRDKKYLKRYRASLEKVLTKKTNLESTTESKENPTNKMKHKMFGYELAISSWNNKICETEKRIEIYSKKHKEIIL
jgi:hypothetical protein